MAKAKLDKTHPELAKQWHPTKNGDLKPNMVTPGSDKKVWWLCTETNCTEGCPHEFQSQINNRAGRGDGCSVCKKNSYNICIHNSVVYTHPEILKEWHPTKNIDITPDKISYASEKKIWWLCKKTCAEGCPHEWLAPFCDRTRGQGCPYCSSPNKKHCFHMSISYTHPEIVKEWHPTKNGILKPEEFTQGSGKKVWWICHKTCKEDCKHEWESNITNRIRLNSGCPFCAGQKNCIHDSIVYTHPELVKQWHPTKNGDLKPSEFKSGSDCTKIWWLCDKRCPQGCPHEWKAVVYSRTSLNCGCPHCCNIGQLCEHVSIVYTHPEILKEWHPSKNGNLKPVDFTKSSPEKPWWICKNGHEFQTKISARCYRGQGCAICRNKTGIKLYDYLLSKYPSLVRELKLETCKLKRYLPYDFCIPELKTIIELDGNQHFKEIKMFKNSVKESLKRDVFKMQKAIKEGYKIIRIYQEDVYKNDIKFLDEHLLPQINNTKEREAVFISSVDSMYDAYIELLEKGDEIILDTSDSDSVD
jgi:very-short-patch-repair endonuclease